MTDPIPLSPVIRDVVDDIADRQRISAGIRACTARQQDFSSQQEMLLAGVAMIPEAREVVTNTLTDYFSASRFLPRGAQDEVIIGAGFHAAVYAANRVRTGFPPPYVIEQGTPAQVGGSFAVSLNPVFRLNSRNRPGRIGLPDQDQALNYLPGAMLQPSMVTSEEYPTNADMAWLIRLTLAQFARVVTGVLATGITAVRANELTLSTDIGDIACGRILDARGPGLAVNEVASPYVITFQQLMERMGNMFPLQGMKQVAVIGGGDSAKCAVESMLGIAPGHSSAIGLDYVQRTDWYAGGSISGRTCSEFREEQRGRYIRIAQYLDGNASNPTTRLRVMNAVGSASPLPDGVLVNDRPYDMAVLCTGGTLPELDDPFTYTPVRNGTAIRTTTLAMKASPYESYRIGPAAGIPFSVTEEESGITAIPANQVAMFRLAPRTAALAATLPAPN